jgi:hypothetical protein
MQDIRLVGNDGEYLNLETQSGDKFRLVLDDTLRSAVKRDSSVQLDSISISPREIQDAVRAGASAQQVSEKHSVPLDYVEKFALTVVDEIGHIIASARSVRIAVAADRYSESSQVEFGEVIAERIATSGGKNATWSAVKFEGLPWQVTVTFDSNRDGDASAAIWSFDQRKLVLSPDNSLAVKLSAGEQPSSVTTAKLRPIEAVSETIAEDVDAQTQVISLPIVASIPEVSEAPSLMVVSSIEELTKVTLEVAEASVSESATDDVEIEPLSATADLLEALRKKRADATKAAEPKLDGAEPASPSPVNESASSTIDEIAPAPVVAPKRGRPSMPSWDEIVFGTKADD